MTLVEKKDLSKNNGTSSVPAPPPKGSLFGRRRSSADERTLPLIRNLLTVKAGRLVRTPSVKEGRRHSFTAPKPSDCCSVMTEDDEVAPAIVTAPKVEPYVAPQFHYTDAAGGEVRFPLEEYENNYRSDFANTSRQKSTKSLGSHTFTSISTMKAGNNSPSLFSNTFFTFRRPYNETTVRETTVQAHIGLMPSSRRRRSTNDILMLQSMAAAAKSTSTLDTEATSTTVSVENHGGDTMQDLVKRLQAQGAKQVFLFPKEEAADLASGKKRIVFLLPQVSNQARFSKEEFGIMTAAAVLKLTPKRPILVEVLTEDVIEGESINVF